MQVAVAKVPRIGYVPCMQPHPVSQFESQSDRLLLHVGVVAGEVGFPTTRWTILRW